MVEVALDWFWRLLSVPIKKGMHLGVGGYNINCNQTEIRHLMSYINDYVQEYNYYNNTGPIMSYYSFSFPCNGT